MNRIKINPAKTNVKCCFKMLITFNNCSTFKTIELSLVNHAKNIIGNRFPNTELILKLLIPLIDMIMTHLFFVHFNNTN